jgi:thiol-disulfide isomerase/thioredoxin
MAAASGTRAARRRRILIALSPVVAVIVIVAILVAVKVSGASNKPKSGAAATSAATQVTTAISTVPASVLDTIGKGTLVTAPTALSGDALTVDGKPRILFVGAEWCPYCAAERWALAVAISRFGRLSGLGEVRSSSTDSYPNTATITFHGATYTSTYLSLTAKEIFSNQVSGSSYARLDTLSAADETLFESVGSGSFPFIDIGGKYKVSATYDPQVLQGRTQAQIAAALSDPTSAIAKGIDGSANVIAAAICAVTGNQPSSVCTSAGIMTAKAALPSPN